jgi:hypothetical protein
LSSHDTCIDDNAGCNGTVCVCDEDHFWNGTICGNINKILTVFGFFPSYLGIKGRLLSQYTQHKFTHEKNEKVKLIKQGGSGFYNFIKRPTFQLFNGLHQGDVIHT